MGQEQWVLAWSQRQNALHVETLERHMQLNREACVDNRPGDYRLLRIGTRAEVDATANSIRPALRRAAEFPAANAEAKA